MARLVSGVPDVRGSLASGTEWLAMSDVSSMKVGTLKDTHWFSSKEVSVDLDWQRQLEFTGRPECSARVAARLWGKSGL